MTTRKHLPLQPGFEVSFKAGARKAGCNMLTAVKLNGALCREAYE
jgi:hypothetical protein